MERYNEHLVTPAEWRILAALENAWWNYRQAMADMHYSRAGFYTMMCRLRHKLDVQDNEELREWYEGS